MNNRVQVRVSIAEKRARLDQKTGKPTKDTFMSLTISDEMTPMFSRLPDVSLKSFAISNETWKEIVKLSGKEGCKWVEGIKKTKKKGLKEPYLSSKASGKVLVLEVELSRPVADCVKASKDGQAFNLSGKIKKVIVRGHRSGNELDLDKA